MDTAMRDLERIEERSTDEGRGVLVLSGVGLIAALGIVVAAVAALPEGSESPPEDPLQMLAIAGAAELDDAEPEPAKDPVCRMARIPLLPRPDATIRLRCKISGAISNV